MKLFACMCNQPQRLWAALAPVHAALVAQPPVARWGLAYAQGGDILIVRTPRPSDKPVDLAAPLAEIPTDCAIGQAVQSGGDERWTGTDDTPPYRYRRWMFAQTSPVDVQSSDAAGAGSIDEAAQRLLRHVPEFLRSQLRTRTPSELVLALFLAGLHDEGKIDDPNVAVSTTLRALVAAAKRVAAERAETGAQSGVGSLVASNGRSMVALRLGAPLRVRRLRLDDEARDQRRSSDSRHRFRGVLLVSGEVGEPGHGFEDVPTNRAVIIHRNLHFEVSDLHS